MTRSSVAIQITPESKPAMPTFMGEAAAFAQALAHTGILKTIQNEIRFARARFGYYDVIDFVVALIGYILSDEPTILAYYERLTPFASEFMALFGRNRLPHRSTLSRFLAALDQTRVEALRTLSQKDLLARSPFSSPGGLFDRTGKQWVVIDVDGTRQAARQRALPQTNTLPAPHRRFDQVCAPGYQGRGHCRPCPLRAQCQESSTTLKPRRVCAVLWPLSSPRSDSEPPLEVTSTLPASAPVLWRDWPRCGIRRTWLKVVRSQTIDLKSSAPLLPPRTEAPAEKIFTRTERAHWRLSWEQRLARNARPANAPRLIVTLHGLPTTFASSFGFDLLATA